MYFEWDAKKSATNETKHGASFLFACDLWKDRVVTFPSNRKGERRKLSIGRIMGEYWTVIWEDRGEVRRIISARRATPSERSLYDSNNK